MAWFQVSFFSQCLSRSVPLNVLIPADLPASPEEVPRPPFKTLYLLHGYLGSASDWLLRGGVQELSEQYHLAVVMPAGDNGFYVNQSASGVLGSDYIGRELVEFTRKLFPLSEKREDTSIGGLSMGGFGALYNGFRYSDVFGHVIALSTPVDYRRFAEPSCEPVELGLHEGFFEALFGDLNRLGMSDKNLCLSAEKLLETGRPLPDLYLACGYNDRLAPDNRAFSAYLSSIGYAHCYEEGPGTHEWPFWSAYLRRGVTRVFPEGPKILPNPFWVDGDAACEGGM